MKDLDQDGIVKIPKEIVEAWVKTNFLMKSVFEHNKRVKGVKSG